MGSSNKCRTATVRPSQRHVGTARSVPDSRWLAQLLLVTENEHVYDQNMSGMCIPIVIYNAREQCVGVLVCVQFSLLDSDLKKARSR